MASAMSANKAELLAIANAVASEKMIDKEIVIEAMEEAIQKSARNRYPNGSTRSRKRALCWCPGPITSRSRARGSTVR